MWGNITEILKRAHRTHGIPLLIIALLPFFYLHTYLDPGETYRSDLLFRTAKGEIIKESILEYGDFYPMWNPYLMSGDMFWARPNSADLLYLPWNLIFFLPALDALKLILVLNIAFAGISMYSLMVSLNIRPQFAIISAFTYMFNGWLMEHFQTTHFSTLAAYPFVPLIILFTIKACKKKDWVYYSIMTGILFSLQVYSGPDLKVMIWTVLIFGLYFPVFILGKNMKKRVAKAVYIFFLIAVVLLGLTAHRIIPTKETLEQTQRLQLPWETASSRDIQPRQFFTRLIEPIYEGIPKIHRTGFDQNIGIVAFILGCFAIWKQPKKRITLYLILVVILSLFLVTGSFVFYVLWKYVPPFGGFRYLTRTVVIFVFAWSVLAGLGSQHLFSSIKSKWPLLSKKAYWSIYTGILSLLILNLLVFGHTPYRDEVIFNYEDAVNKNPILKDLSERPGYFRIHTYETNGIDWSTDFYTVPLKLEHILGAETAWDPRYLNEFLSIANKNPAKLWGLLNVKWVTAQNKIDVSGLELVKEYPPCTACDPHERLRKAWGPYLYENTLFLPRAYIAHHAILVVGETSAAKNVMYSLLISPDFKTSTTIVVLGPKEKIDQYDLGFLERFDAILLTQGSVGNSPPNALSQYIAAGGTIFPNILSGETNANPNEISMFLKTLATPIDPIEDNKIVRNSFDDIRVSLPKSGGFLVMSEKFSLYPWWHAFADDKEVPLYVSDGVITAVPLNEEDTIEFKFIMKSILYSAIVTLFTILLLLIYLSTRIRKRRQGQTAKEENGL